jgi:uncharacterized protein YggE
MSGLAGIRLALVGCWIGLLITPMYGSEPRRLSVTGVGKVDVRPDAMELTTNVTASAEMTTDALKKFRDNRRRGVAAIEKLKIPGLEIKGSGVSVLSNATMQQFQQMFNNGAQQGSQGHTTFSETLTITVPGIDRLPDDQVEDLATKILDAAKDAGLTIGQPVDSGRRYYDYNSYHPQIASFRVVNAEAARQKALDIAAQNAQKSAEQMAKRLGLTLGKPVSARDSKLPGNVVVQNLPQRLESPLSETSTTLHSIPVEAVLAVDYELGN